MANNPVDKHVGNRVRMRRIMLQMSQTELANAIGVTFQQVQKYEKGTNRISASRLQRLAERSGQAAPRATSKNRRP
jgi:transcriptional regulator with XRE-family HTH domain